MWQIFGNGTTSKDLEVKCKSHSNWCDWNQGMHSRIEFSVVLWFMWIQCSVQYYFDVNIIVDLYEFN